MKLIEKREDGSFQVSDVGGSVGAPTRTLYGLPHPSLVIIFVATACAIFLIAWRSRGISGNWAVELAGRGKTLAVVHESHFGRVTLHQRGKLIADGQRAGNKLRLTFAGREPLEAEIIGDTIRGRAILMARVI